MGKKKEGEISKMDAVRKALADGVTKPTDGVEYLKEKFDIEMKPTMFSTYKSNIQRKEGGGVSIGSGKTKAEAGGVTIGNGLAAAREVKSLVEKYGADTVRGYLDLFDE